MLGTKKDHTADRWYIIDKQEGNKVLEIYYESKVITRKIGNAF